MYNTQAKKPKSLAYNKCFVFIKYSREDGSGSRHEKFRIRLDLACNPDPVSSRLNTCLDTVLRFKKNSNSGVFMPCSRKKTYFFLLRQLPEIELCYFFLYKYLDKVARTKYSLEAMYGTQLLITVLLEFTGKNLKSLDWKFYIEFFKVDFALVRACSCIFLNQILSFL
jgi:hypothetical protein